MGEVHAQKQMQSREFPRNVITPAHSCEPRNTFKDCLGDPSIWSGFVKPSGSINVKYLVRRLNLVSPKEYISL